MKEICIIFYIENHSEKTVKNFDDFYKDIDIPSNVYIISAKEIPSYFEDHARRGSIFIDQNAPIKNIYEAFNFVYKKLEKRDIPVFLISSSVQLDWNSFKELYDILTINEKHGIVTPRLKCCIELENIPRYSIAQTFDMPCFVVRGQLIENFGGFDTQGICEANCIRDLCMRINKYGYSTLVANHANIHEAEVNKTVCDWEADIEFFSRYPYYRQVENIYNNLDKNPIDHFSHLLSQSSLEKKKILFSLYNALPFYSGSVVHSLKELESFYELFCDKYEIHVLINRKADNYFNISHKYPCVVYPDTITQLYHLAFSPTQFFHLEHLILLHRHALKIMFTLQDIIGIRCAYNMSATPEIKFLFNFSIKYVDGIFTFSDYSRKDFCTYFNSDHYRPLPKTKTIYLGAEKICIESIKTSELPFKEYILIFGNHFAHKSIIETVEVIRDKCLNKNFIIVGLPEDTFEDPNIRTYPSGSLTKEFIISLYADAEALLFPSQYEGFGLPIVEALQFGKPVVLFNTELNRELFRKLLKEYDQYAFFFDYFHEIPDRLKSLDASSGDRKRIRLAKTFRNWQDVAVEIEKFISEILEDPIDYRKLEERFFCFQALDFFHSSSSSAHNSGNTFQVQVFLNTGKNYSEAESLTCLGTRYTTILEFNILKFKNLKRLRFDPMNLPGMIFLQSAHLISEDDCITDMPISSHNANISISQFFLFETDDPSIEFDVRKSGNYKKLVISIRYIHIGKDMLADSLRKNFAPLTVALMADSLRQWKAKSKKYFNQFKINLAAKVQKRKR
ncbi:glycosyltransferase [Candidatus Parcubacteria bacterium]|nr:MAG: glycosyltransferase [Candidatus Parcubacteria bacterium]